jgi:hypothetical protein
MRAIFWALLLAAVVTIVLWLLLVWFDERDDD